MTEYSDSNRNSTWEKEPENLISKNLPNKYDEYSYNLSANGQMENSQAESSQPQNMSTLMSTMSVDEYISALQQDHASSFGQNSGSILKRTGNFERFSDQLYHYQHSNLKDLPFNQSNAYKDVQSFQGIQMAENFPMQSYHNSSNSFNDNYYDYPNNFPPSINTSSVSGNCINDGHLINFDVSPEPVTVFPSTVSPNSILYSLITSGDAPLLSESNENDLFSSNYQEVEALTSLLDLSVSATETQTQNVVQLPSYSVSPTSKITHAPLPHHNSYIDTSNGKRSILPPSNIKSEEFLRNESNSHSILHHVSEEAASKYKHHRGEYKESIVLSNDQHDNSLLRSNDYRHFPKSTIPLNYNCENTSNQPEIERKKQVLPSVCSASLSTIDRTNEYYVLRSTPCQPKNSSGEKNYVRPVESFIQICDANHDTESPLDLRGEQSPPSIEPPKASDPPQSKSKRTKKVKSRERNSQELCCHECDITFATRALLVKHRQMYKHRKAYNCEHCSFQFHNMSTLRVHLRLHTGEKPFKCEYCEKSFIDTSSLIKHKRTHTGDKPHKCKECHKSFRLLSTLKSHYLTHTGQKPFECEVCGARFTQNSSLRRHKTSHNDSDVRPFKCEQCGVSFRTKSIYAKHLKNHLLKSKHSCEVCGKGFTNNKRLKIHLMVHNEGERPFKCNKCSSEFKSPKYLTQHKRRIHGHSEEIHCEDCDASFKRKENYRSHIKVHLGNNLTPCPDCKANFNNLVSLRKHMRRHLKTNSIKTSPLDPQELKENSGSISSPNPSRSNRKALELETEESSKNQPIKCTVCRSTFFRTRQFKAHQRYCTPMDVTSSTPANEDQQHSNSSRLISSTGPVNSFNQNSDISHVYYNDKTDINLLGHSTILPVSKQSNAYKLLSAVFEVTDNKPP